MITFLLIIEDTKMQNKLEDIYICYHKQMYYIAMSILNNAHDAQDAVQIAILKCVDYIKKIEDINCNRTKNLIVTIIKSTAIDIYRHKKKYPHKNFDNFIEQPMNTSYFTEDIIIRLSDSKYYAERLAELKPEYAEILTLRYYEELNDMEIAELLNISHGNVRARLSRSKAALKKLLVENGNGRKQAYES
ncbi:MAG: sigma-70 family RNA polymerase sigma factor [Vallitaleaceae bacterium]|jgi:RNA polymerase sigma-70 factor (ECF subfamily)|nr:sigma-70 family RNA polymerase sigma factor [Vallitaleaceae bacterium]